MRSTTLVATIAMMLVPLGAGGQSLIPCAPPLNSLAGSMESGIRDVLNDTSSSAVDFRAHSDLPANPLSVSIVADSAICNAAALAVAARDSAAGPPHPVWVIRVDTTRFVVFGREWAGSRGLASTFDATFAWLANFVF